MHTYRMKKIMKSLRVTHVAAKIEIWQLSCASQKHYCLKQHVVLECDTMWFDQADQCLIRICLVSLYWKWGQQIRVECWYLSTKLLSVASQNTVLFIVTTVRNSDLIMFFPYKSVYSFVMLQWAESSSKFNIIYSVHCKYNKLWIPINAHTLCKILQVVCRDKLSYMFWWVFVFFREMMTQRKLDIRKVKTS
jgi:hypothetical protein